MCCGTKRAARVIGLLQEVEGTLKFQLYLLPRHVCTTVNNFDDAPIVRRGAIEFIEKVSARGHEPPLLSSLRPAAR
jgi:hypothetical protein